MLLRGGNTRYFIGRSAIAPLSFDEFAVAAKQSSTLDGRNAGTETGAWLSKCSGSPLLLTPRCGLRCAARHYPSLPPIIRGASALPPGYAPLASAVAPTTRPKRKKNRTGLYPQEILNLERIVALKPDLVVARTAVMRNASKTN